MPTRPRGPLLPPSTQTGLAVGAAYTHDPLAPVSGVPPPASAGSVPWGDTRRLLPQSREACFGRDLGRREGLQSPDQSCPTSGARSPGKAALPPAGAAAPCPARPTRGLAGSSRPSRGGFALSPRAGHICGMGAKSRPPAEHLRGRGPVTFPGARTRTASGYAQTVQSSWEVSAKGGEGQQRSRGSDPLAPARLSQHPRRSPGCRLASIRGVGRNHCSPKLASFPLTHDTGVA